MGNGIENRFESRVVCTGEVRLSFENGPSAVAELMDVSGHGFRVRHKLDQLEAGAKVAFEHHFFVGEAEVVWNAVKADEFQAGFRVLRPM